MIANKMNICSRDIQQFCNTIFDKKNMDDFAERIYMGQKYLFLHENK